MQKLNTIQKREKLNEVIARGEKGNGGAYHEYQVIFGDIESQLTHDLSHKHGEEIL